MSENMGNKPRKRGQRKNNLDIPQRFLDRLSPSVLETSRLEQNEGASASPETLTLEGLFKRFYTARQAAGAAERTLEDYRKHMRWFRQFLASEYSGLDNFVPNRDVVRAWISHMLTVQKLMPSTINIRLRTVKAMFNWCLSEQIISESPFQNVELLRVPEEDFQIISKAQERKLFDCCELTTFMGLRDALLMSFLLDTGVRIGECMRIFVEEVDLQSRSATVRASSAKNRKARTVYFGQRTRELLAVYMAWHERNAKAPNLFLNEYGEPLDKNWATRCVSAIGKRAKITGVRISPHTFRHTFATRYIKATGDPFSLRRLLGHSSMEMVNRYVNQDATDVREQYEKFMDRGDRNW